jgi:hypothetical protein
VPAVSQAQRGYLARKFGPAWMRRHHFDNKGPLPAHASHVTAALKKRRRKKSGR